IRHCGYPIVDTSWRQAVFCCRTAGPTFWLTIECRKPTSAFRQANHLYPPNAKRTKGEPNYSNISGDIFMKSNTQASTHFRLGKKTATTALWMAALMLAAPPSAMADIDIGVL